MLSEKEKKEALEHYQTLRLIDNELMNIAFQDNNEAVEYVVQTILKRKDLKVITTEIQRVQTLPNNNRSVILDILAKDVEGKIYNIEMENTPTRATAERARYNSNLIDATLLNKGDLVTELPEKYVIFITDGIFLGMKDVPIAEFRMYNRRYRKYLGDKQTRIFVNALCMKGDSELTSLKKDLTARRSEEINSQVLKKAVEYAKGEKGKGMYIEGLNKNQEELLEAGFQKGLTQGVKQGIEQGMKQGVKQGIKQGIVQSVRNYSKLGISPDVIAKASGFTLEEVKNIIDSAKE